MLSAGYRLTVCYSGENALGFVSKGRDRRSTQSLGGFEVLLCNRKFGECDAIAKIDPDAAAEFRLYMGDAPSGKT
ncbi:MAG: hypothetical protein SVX43_20620 [Cyanobacteriota bacterium]|nr:hypothetical protein [Cyanobacteriota bacterium]